MDQDAAEVTRLVVAALKMSGHRGVLLRTPPQPSHASNLAADPLPDSIFPIESAPHAWLFPQMAAVVHHGGAGTTAAGLRAGVPSVIVPFFADQPFWGRRVANLGAGPAPIPRKQLTAERLAAAICRATSDLAMQRRAAEVGECLGQEDGVKAAVEVIERLAASSEPVGVWLKPGKK